MRQTTQSNRGALALGSLALAFFAMGCGGQREAATSAPADAGQEVVAASAPAVAAAPAVGIAAEAVPAVDGTVEFSNDSLPPDVVASVVSTEVTPGTIIEVTAEGSPDVEEVLLADGRGTPQRFVYDAAADLWRASYRVPVRFPGERLGLAVTAKNQLHRWRRVWVFLTATVDSSNVPARGEGE